MARQPIGPRAILVGGWVAFMVYAFPGYLGWDAMTQLAQARRGHYTDDHPPAMAMIWGVLEHLVHGPLLMLLALSVPFVAGLYWIFRRYLPERPAAIVAVLVLWFPPIVTIMAAIFKDTVMATCLVAGLPLLALPRRSWIGLVLMGAATLFRYNALAATFPLVVLLWRYRESHGWRRYAIAMVAWLGLTGAALGTAKVLADEESHYWYWSHALMDIAGTLEYAHDYPDTELEQMFAGAPLLVHDHIQGKFRAIYAPVDFRHLFAGPHPVLSHKPETAGERAAIARVWKQLLSNNPGAYLRYRWDNFSALMRFDHAVYMNTYARFTAYGHPETEFLDYDAAPSRLQRHIADAMIAVSETPLFDPRPYFVLALLLLPLALGDRFASAVLASGLIYQLAWFFLAPTADYRYSHWLVTTTVIGAILVFVRRYRPQAIVT